MNSTVTAAVAWPANTAIPPVGWDRLTDTDHTQPSGWFTTSHDAYRTVVKGYPTWDDVPWDIPADLRYHDEDEDYAFLRGTFDFVSTMYRFPDVDTAAGPATHGFGNLDFVGGWPHPLAMLAGRMREGDALLARVLSGAKPVAELIGSQSDAWRWAVAACGAGMDLLVYRDWNARLWLAPARLGERVSRGALTATWHALAGADLDRARAARLLPVIDRGLEQAFALDLHQSPVQRGTVMQPGWWDEHSSEGWVVLGAVLGYPPATTYARLIGC